MLVPKGHGKPVILAPGYFADDYSLWPLGNYLKFLGYKVYYADLGRNMGHVIRDTHRLGERIQSISSDLGNVPVTVIGWSLGGVLVREVARLYSSVVQEVITLGSPIIGGPKFTFFGSQYASANQLDLNQFEQFIHERNLLGLSQPITSIYSKSDGVVGWQASIDTYNPHARNIEVCGSHIGLGVNAKVWRVIAKTLAG